MSKLVTVKQGDFYYVVPLHEFVRYWAPQMSEVEVPTIPEGIPYVSKLAGLKRGKGVKRVTKAYEQKGGNHDGFHRY